MAMLPLAPSAVQHSHPQPKESVFISITLSLGKRPLLWSLFLYGTAEDGIREVELWKLSTGNGLASWQWLFAFPETFAGAVAQKTSTCIKLKFWSQ